jgi:hypothetical protein
MTRGEDPHDAVWAFMQAAASKGLKFKRLEVLGLFRIGGHELVRFKADGEGFHKVLDELRPKRAVSVLNGGGYRLYLPDGREGSVPTITMLATSARTHQRVYKGPGDKLWKRQFLDLQGD